MTHLVIRIKKKKWEFFKSYFFIFFKNVFITAVVRGILNYEFNDPRGPITVGLLYLYCICTFYIRIIISIYLDGQLVAH